MQLMYCTCINIFGFSNVALVAQGVQIYTQRIKTKQIFLQVQQLGYDKNIMWSLFTNNYEY
jgi:hypothetical protein